MDPFRSPSGDLAPAEPFDRRIAPEVLAFAAGENAYRVILRDDGAVVVATLSRREPTVAERVVLGGAGANVLAIASRDTWAVFESLAGGVRVWGSHTREPTEATFASLGVDPSVVILPVMLEGRAALVLVVDQVLRVVSADLRDVLVEGWTAPISARAPLAATSTVFGPAVIFATDRPDEIDVCVFGAGGETLQRTVSLGRDQRFERAAGGGTRIAVLSRDARGLVVRTLARDVKSELNPVPIRPHIGWDVGEAQCAYANGPFVVAHGERRDGVSAAVITVFDAGEITTSRILLPGAHGLAVEGKDLAVAGTLGGASAPVLEVQRMTTAGGKHRRYLYLLETPAPATPSHRHALLFDLADIIARSFGGAHAVHFALHAAGPDADVATFEAPGADAAHELAIAILCRHDGSGVATLRVGGGHAPEPAGLGFLARLREALTGDDDGDPSTTRVEVPHLWTGVEQILAVVGAMLAIADVP